MHGLCAYPQEHVFKARCCAEKSSAGPNLRVTCKLKLDGRYALIDRPQLGAYFLAFRKTKAENPEMPSSRQQSQTKFRPSSRSWSSG